jgi:hypothetical protein
MSKNQTFGLILAVVSLGGFIGAMTTHAAGELDVALAALLGSLAVGAVAFWSWKR